MQFHCTFSLEVHSKVMYPTIWNKYISLSKISVYTRETKVCQILIVIQNLNSIEKNRFLLKILSLFSLLLPLGRHHLVLINTTSFSHLCVYIYICVDRKNPFSQQYKLKYFSYSNSTQLFSILWSFTMWQKSWLSDYSYL